VRREGEEDWKIRIGITSPGFAPRAEPGSAADSGHLRPEPIISLLIAVVVAAALLARDRAAVVRSIVVVSIAQRCRGPMEIPPGRTPTVVSESVPSANGS